MSEPGSSADPAARQRVRAALGAVHEALDHHLDAVEARSGEADPAVFAAYDHLRDAVIAYDDMVYDVHDEVLPVEIVEWADEDDEDLQGTTQA